MNCIIHKKKFIHNVRLLDTLNSVKIGFSVMGFDFLVMFFVKLLFSITPLVSIQLNMKLYETIDTYLTQDVDFLTIEIILAVVIYSFFMWVCRLEIIFYERYVLQYGSLLKFECLVKNLIHERCAKLSGEAYAELNLNQYTYEARVASINIYRIIQIIIEFITSFVGIVSISGFFLNLNRIYIVLIIFATLPTAGEFLIEVLEQEKGRTKRLRYMRKEKVLRESIYRPDYFKENYVNNSFDFLITKWKNNQAAYNELDEAVSKKFLGIELLGGIIALVGKTGGIIVAVYVLFLEKDYAQFASVMIAFGAIERFVNGIAEHCGYLTMFVSMVRPFFALFEIDIDAEENTDNYGLSKRICLENVSYCYGGQDVLKSINLTIQQGEKVAIVGKNGSGKSTLLKLVLGLYKPTSGRIIEDGIMDAKRKDEFRGSRKTAVFQKICKYPLSFKKNIIISDAEKPRDKINLEKLRDEVGLNTIELSRDLGRQIGSFDLSGGEWQRLAVARALYRDADFIALDEFTSAADAMHERAMYELIDEMSKNKTLLLVTHHFGILKHMDKIVVMREGMIDGVGSHEYLLDCCDTYKELWNMTNF